MKKVITLVIVGIMTVGALKAQVQSPATKQFHFVFTDTEINYIVSILYEKPVKDALPIIQDILAQAQNQTLQVPKADSTKPKDQKKEKKIN